MAACSSSHDNSALGVARPHCIQVLGVLQLLASASQGPVESRVAEVLTGQGKSWVLLLLGCVFAVTGKDAVVVCHNEDLTARDEKNAQAFLDLLARGAPAATDGNSLPTDGNSLRFGSVEYKTFKRMCFDAITLAVRTDKTKVGDEMNMSLDQLVSYLLSSPTASTDSHDIGQFQWCKPKHHHETVLLIDEVRARMRAPPCSAHAEHAGCALPPFSQHAPLTTAPLSLHPFLDAWPLSRAGGCALL